MLAFTPSKINLGLNIIQKRTDGYHDIESVFYPINWCDVLEVLPAEQFSFSTSGLAIPGESENNLIVKAYQMLKSEGFIPSGQSVKIHLHKVIPMGAGLGGGSSNGAFALKMINEVLGLGLNEDKLKDLAAKLGSDSPFFIQSEPAFCSGKGTEMEYIFPILKGKYIVLVNPGIHISTQEAYGSIRPNKPEYPVKEMINRPIDRWKNVLVNDFEAPLALKYPLISEIKTRLYENGAVYASMTGSGSTVYGIFENEINLENEFSSMIYWGGRL